MKYKKLAIVAIAFPITSMLLYGFTGLPIWAPTDNDDVLRILILSAAHLFPPFFGFAYLMTEGFTK